MAEESPGRMEHDGTDVRRADSRWLALDVSLARLPWRLTLAAQQGLDSPTRQPSGHVCEGFLDWCV